VTGGNGLLGSKVLSAACGRFRLVSIDLHVSPVVQYNDLEYLQGDVTERETIQKRIFDARPDCVIHTAAFTDVDGCEKEREEAWKANVQGTENVAISCRTLDIKMIHLSTDYVFDGKSGPYSEEDEPHPISFYGKIKLESEKVVQEHLENFIIARTMVLYGYSPKVRHNFVTWLVEKLSQRERVTIVEDQYGNPTLVDDLAKALLILFERDGCGIYHTAGKDWLNRYDFAVSVAKVFQLDRSLIGRTTTDCLNQPAPRPLKSGLKSNKILREFGVTFSQVEEGLRRMREQMEAAGV